MSLYDDAGKRRLRIGLMPEGPALQLIDGTGERRAGLSVDNDGPGLALYAADGHPLFSAPKGFAKKTGNGKAKSEAR